MLSAPELLNRTEELVPEPVLDGGGELLGSEALESPCVVVCITWVLPAVEGYEVVENKFELLWRKALSLVVANELLEEDNVDFREGSAEEYEGVELI